MEHRPGRKHGNADGLSWRPFKQCGINDLEPEVSDSPEKDTHYCRAVVLLPEEASELRVEQIYDEMCKEFVAGVEAGQRPPKVGAGLVAERRKFWSEFPRLIVKEGLLGQEWVADDGSEHWQCYMPEILRSLFDEVHAERKGGHLGFDKTLRQLRLKFCYGMSQYVQVWCAACRQCQRQKGPSRVPGRLSCESPMWSTKFVLEIKGASCTRIYWRKSAVSNCYIYSIIRNINIAMNYEQKFENKDIKKSYWINERNHSQWILTMS